jgi:hypothetical protein
LGLREVDLQESFGTSQGSLKNGTRYIEKEEFREG